jgi:DNA-binding NtrC family response regulator
MTTDDEARALDGQSAVLLVDDEVHIVDGLRAALRRYPFQVHIATSGAQALKVLDDHAIDVVVSDEQMPSITGSELLGIVRQRYPQTLRIILTGQASLDAAIRAINEGEVYRFLTKPCSPVDLALTIQRALQLRNLARHSARLLARTRAQDRILQDLEHRHPGISDVKRNVHGAIMVDEMIDVDELIRQLERENR